MFLKESRRKISDYINASDPAELIINHLDGFTELKKKTWTFSNFF